MTVRKSMATLDFESLGLDGESIIRILPDKRERQYYVHGNMPIENNFKTCFAFNNAKLKTLFNAIRLPERKFVHWRKKKMLVSKTRPQQVQMNMPFDLLKDLRKYG